jgi:hypothetical protein
VHAQLVQLVGILTVRQQAVVLLHLPALAYPLLEPLWLLFVVMEPLALLVARALVHLVQGICTTRKVEHWSA